MGIEYLDHMDPRADYFTPNIKKNNQQCFNKDMINILFWLRKKAWSEIV